MPLMRLESPKHLDQSQGPDTPWEVVGPAQRPAEPDGVPGLSKVVSEGEQGRDPGP
jgi:hypothetical protein